MYSAYKLNKQGDNIQPWCTPFPIWNQSVVPCPVLTVAFWPTYRFLKRQVRWSGVPISLRTFHSLLWSTQSKALAAEPRQKQHPVVDVTGDGSKIQCCKEQYCIGTWSVLSMNQGKLEAVKQEMTRIWKYLTWNSRILGISELKRTGQDSSPSDRTRTLVMFQINCTCG